MSDVRVEPFDLARHDLARLRTQFEQLYAHMAERSARALLAPGGFDRWYRGYERQAGRARLILVADGPAFVGFAEGSIRLPPAFYQPEPAGYVQHVYVDPEIRGAGVGAALWRGLKAWFDTLEVAAYELHVVRGNTAAQDFWRRQGFADDNLQMRRPR